MLASSLSLLSFLIFTLSKARLAKLRSFSGFVWYNIWWFGFILVFHFFNTRPTNFVFKSKARLIGGNIQTLSNEFFPPIFQSLYPVWFLVINGSIEVFLILLFGCLLQFLHMQFKSGLAFNLLLVILSIFFQHFLVVGLVNVRLEDVFALLTWIRWLVYFRNLERVVYTLGKSSDSAEIWRAHYVHPSY